MIDLIRRLFGKASPPKEKPNPLRFFVCEGVEGRFLYHIHAGTDQKRSSRALCGATVMRTEVPLDAWGYVGHLNERYCLTCGSALNSEKMIAFLNEGNEHAS